MEKKLHAIRFSKKLDPKKEIHVLVKDNIGVEDFFTSAGSKALETLRLPDAFCIRKLKEAGVDVFGKTHMTELAGFLSTRDLSEHIPSWAVSALIHTVQSIPVEGRVPVLVSALQQDCATQLSELRQEAV